MIGDVLGRRREDLPLGAGLEQRVAVEAATIGCLDDPAHRQQAGDRVVGAQRPPGPRARLDPPGIAPPMPAERRRSPGTRRTAPAMAAIWCLR